MSLRAVMHTHGGMLRPLLSTLSEPWDNLASIDALAGMQSDTQKKRVMLLSGLMDDFIYPAHMETLYKRLSGIPCVDAHILQFSNGGHIAMYDEPGYYEAFAHYFSSPSDIDGHS